MIQLSPPDEDIERLAEKELAEAREFVRKMKIVLTNRPEEGEEDQSAAAARH